jgi:hypothetical protein
MEELKKNYQHQLFKNEIARWGPFLKLFIYSHVHTLFWVISPPCLPPPPSSPFPPQFQAGPALPLSLILLKKRDKHNKKGKVFLLVELRIAIQKYS